MYNFVSEPDDKKPDQDKPQAPSANWTDPAPEKSSSEEKSSEPVIRDWASI